MALIRLPGLVDAHVHVREPGATHKEDWDSCTAAALAGGITAILAMPNTRPPVTDAATLELSLRAAERKARCDYAQFLGAATDNPDSAPELAPRTAGLKLYLDSTYGPLRLDEEALWLRHLSRWPAEAPLCAHAEGAHVARIIALANQAGRGVHICHVATREEIEAVRDAREAGMKVTCEAAPHHLFLSTADLPNLPGGRGEVRPRLASPDDQAALLENLAVIDCFATDHAPHTLAEKDGGNPPPGFPGLETSLPLLYRLVREDKLSLEELVSKMYTAPRRIFRLPEQPQTWVEFEEGDFRVESGGLLTRSAWSPFEGMPTAGRVRRVVLRGKLAYEIGQVIAQPGSGMDLRAGLSNE